MVITIMHAPRPYLTESEGNCLIHYYSITMLGTLSGYSFEVCYVLKEPVMISDISYDTLRKEETY